jgi:hypothetical protein
MIPSIYKFGRYLLYAFNNEEQANSIILPGEKSLKEVRNLAYLLKKLTGRYILAIDTTAEVQLHEHSLGRLLQTARNTQAGIVYSDYLLEKENKLIPHPLNEYQPGSIRDDFNFGHILLFSRSAVKTVLKKYGSLPQEEKAAPYDLRLKISLDHEIFHVPEFLYTVVEKKPKASRLQKDTTEKHFDYATAKNHIQQKVLEKVATNYLKLIGAHIKARTKKAPHNRALFPVEASVIIPVLNRKKTIATAISSALSQKTGFDYNIIVVDNHSTDGTTDVIEKLASLHREIIQIIPGRRNLSVGGCWNEAIYSPFCGRFAIQLDSDDLYSTSYTLQKIVDALQEGNYAMVIGSYTIVNRRLEKIPPGLIDHREWTQTNGYNNIIRVNGLGAPRAFNTTILRQIGFPNVGYGEDYAVALRISREYQIKRIYESLYLCRRWQENTDAALSPEKQNRNDFYKDKLRTLEIKARQTMNKPR